jgi:hypothetical protein
MQTFLEFRSLAIVTFLQEILYSIQFKHLKLIYIPLIFDRWYDCFYPY